ncbi:uncharacterized protein DUF397 [Lentzea atacamensis]|uniref:Uncharacterized protein DUF397 n=1 Tax=Lentzea atacamensis TaxID=531938 RepID=A0ABX9DUE5_9PSEU|nr:DUF397 domain-containing protein [Lentzea atacamensis]RAS57840.1 uncharacterized protein DUF397 [Lentzea atacamensis]
MTGSTPNNDDKAHVRGQLDLSGAQWQSGGGDPDEEHVEVAFVRHTDGEMYAAMRMSTEPDGPVLVFTMTEWHAFVAGAKDGEFDEPW